MLGRDSSEDGSNTDSTMRGQQEKQDEARVARAESRPQPATRAPTRTQTRTRTRSRSPTRGAASSQAARAQPRQQPQPSSRLLWLLLVLAASECQATPDSSLRFEPSSNAYQGLTFTFDPRLDKRVEWLQFEHWLALVQHTSGLMYQSLAGRAHLASVQVLVPYKWRQSEWPALHKPGVPVMSNRRLKFADSDVIVGFEEPTYKETPFALQHDECARQGLNIHMPISFLENNNQLDVKLKARLLMREFASHRYGLFKESGFRSDPMYPPFSSLPGHPTHAAGGSSKSHQTRVRQQNSWSPSMQLDATSLVNQSAGGGPSLQMRGFDPQWNECSFDTMPANGLPASHALQCAPFLVRPDNWSGSEPSSFNLMSSDPFSYVEVGAFNHFRSGEQASPLEWRDLAWSGDNSTGTQWHFCGDQFQWAAPLGRSANLSRPMATGSQAARHPHNQLALNKQNIMCNERSAMDVIRSSEDFRRAPFSPSTFNRLPETTFKFLQEMPPRVILCVEYAAHLYQSRRLDHGILEAAIGKWLAYDLIADSEFGLVLFGQQHSHRYPFKRLDSSVDARLTLFSLPIDPFEEPARFYTDQELLQLGVSGLNSHQSGHIKILKGTCSLARLIAETQHLIQQGSKYDDQGADLVIVSSGLFIEDEQKIEELLKASNIQPDSVQLNLIIYPTSMLFDTKSHNGIVVLDASQSESIIKNRVDKLLLLQRLTGAKIHLVREHLDANGDVRMSTLLQFYQIFHHISSGHSWDQTHSMVMLNQEQVVETSRVSQSNTSQSSNQLHRLQFQFQLDNSLENELVVGFIDPKQTRSQRSGKRFTLRNLQLRSPSGHLVLTDPTTASLVNGDNKPIEPTANIHTGAQFNHDLDSMADQSMPAAGINEQLIADQDETLRSSNAITESALFPYRAQLGLAGFHLRPSHLISPLNSSRRSAGSSGLWTLSAQSDEPVHTSAVSLARVNPAGDSITAHCWVQSYLSVDEDREPARSTKSVKVFVQLRSGPTSGPVQEVSSRMEVEDESGNIVQNVNMLDDGLGAPDMTRGDGIYTQFVRRAHKPGFYRVTVEVSGASQEQNQHRTSQHSKQRSSSAPVESASQGKLSETGQDNPCCGSFIRSSGLNQPDTRFLSRQIYCGTFYVDQDNRLAQQRPSRVNDLTVVNVDQENRRVVIRWNEPQSESMSAQASRAQHFELADANQANVPNDQSTDSTSIHVADLTSASHQIDASEDQQTMARPRAIVTHSNPDRRSVGPIGSKSNSHPRYEIKLFTDREMAKRAFDAKQDVGLRFNEWNIEGSFPNASQYGGKKEVTLKIAYAREGIYYVAMKVYNKLGLDSPMSNIVQFWMRANTSQLNDSVDSIYGQPVSVDADGNMYDKNGEPIQRSQQWPYGSQLMSPLDNLSMLLVVCLVAFLLCISLIACLAGSARKSLLHSKRKSKSSSSSDKPAMILASNGSSLASSHCASSQQSELASSASLESGHSGHEADMNKLALGADESKLCHREEQQQQLVADWHNQHQYVMSGEHLYQQHQQQQQQQQQQLNHTIINGYAYAMVNNSNHLHSQQPQHIHDLGLIQSNPVQSWTADVLLSHYDKVKEAHERNEAPPVMRVETLDPNQQSEGLPTIEEHQQTLMSNEFRRDKELSYLLRRPSSRSSVQTNHLNQQLQQQLNSVLKSKRVSQNYSQPGNNVNSHYNYDPHHTSPALEGLTDTLSELSAPIDRLVIPPPPPHYLYANGLTSEQLQQQQQSMLTEPSIYSQLTNLKQMTSSNLAHDPSQYYANQWQCRASIAEQQQQATSPCLVNEGIEANAFARQFEDAKPAISDV